MTLFKKLGALTGSEKQIAWAEKIRQATLLDVQNYLKTDKVPWNYKRQIQRHLIAVSQFVGTQTRAADWIDNRNKSTRWLISEAQDILRERDRRKKTRSANQTTQDDKKMTVQQLWN